MKVVWSWLLELCDLDRQPTVEEGAAALTRAGIEIEGITPLGDAFSGVVVAEVVAKRPHPDSTKLTLVDVITDKGGTATQVVCGASNVPAPGRKVLWAQIVARQPNGMTLAEKPVKGIVSPGMLCSEDELGLGDDHDGIVVLDDTDTTQLGAPAQKALFLDDTVLDINAPANRGDVLGHLGIARELCAVLRGKLVLPDVDLTDFAGGTRPRVDLAIADAQACPRYVARVIDGLTIKPSPRRIAQRLRAVGVRAIGNLVDVTNYVLFELGQPLHAFDMLTLKSHVLTISPANDGEPFTTLDNVKRTLVADDLMIRDGDRAIALAGVMGGLDTEVTATTTRVLLESASFAAKKIRRTARRLGLHSEASHRFERGVDAELCELASARAARLLCQVGGGRVLGDAVDAYPSRKSPAKIAVRLPRVRLLSGVALDEATCTDALRRLEHSVEASGDTALYVTPPSARPDVAREVDVIEEILRIVGYEQVPSSLPVLRAAPPLREHDRGDRARAALGAAGGSEAITFAFQSVERCSALGLAATDRRSQPIALRNPMSADQAVMRTSLVPNLVAAVARNTSHGRPDVNLFEVGSVFLRRGEGITEAPPHELADEPVFAAGVLAGRCPEGIGHGRAWDVFDAKALALIAIRAVAGDVALRVHATQAVPYLHPGVAGEIVAGELGAIGWFGEVHPDVRKRLGVDVPVIAYEIALAALPVAPPAQMRAIPRFPRLGARRVAPAGGEHPGGARRVEVIAAANEPLIAGVEAARGLPRQQARRRHEVDAVVDRVSLARPDAHRRRGRSRPRDDRRPARRQPTGPKTLVLPWSWLPDS